ncbi:cell division protein SepF [Aquibacillus albus]|uniref:Cell division protein SepF n=1 Tax=Aquibacillus albus TaxID=1168171 RepID=A0ABS2N114_9BACI|nr:cell division protein SepF [Aquibacillus albus]MBM7571748.1 cell division inhibitor SepF [Aquibacillus albus]
MSIKSKIKTFFTVDDDYDYVEENVDEPQPLSRSSRSENVVSLKSVTNSAKVVLCEPRSYNEAQDIADHLVNRRSVVVNLQRVEHIQAKRIIDFLSGTVYAVSGGIQKLGPQTFLCTPENVDVSGTITEMLEEEEIERGW